MGYFTSSTTAFEAALGWGAFGGHGVNIHLDYKFTLAQIADVARRAGLTIDKQCYFFGALFPAVAAVRMARRLLHPSAAPASDAEHVRDELLQLNTRDIDDPEFESPRQVEVGETELDRDPPSLFLLEPVGVYAGQGLDQRGLAVVDVAGGAEDQMLHTVTPSC